MCRNNYSWPQYEECDRGLTLSGSHTTVGQTLLLLNEIDSWVLSQFNPQPYVTSHVTTLRVMIQCLRSLILIHLCSFLLLTLPVSVSHTNRVPSEDPAATYWPSGLRGCVLGECVYMCVCMWVGNVWMCVWGISTCKIIVTFHTHFSAQHTHTHLTHNITPSLWHILQ